MDLSAAAATSGLQRIVFGVYRDGDNNLDAVQERNVTDFVRATKNNPALKVVAEDTTAIPRAPFRKGDLRTEWSVIESGTQHVVRIESARDMSSRATLAAFVNRTLEARATDGKFQGSDVWLDLVDHGAGDGGGLESDANGGACMSMEDIAGAIADGKAQFLKNHPNGNANVTGVLANQCLMATLGFADALSRSGVQYLAASPETMLTPGAPSAQIAQSLTQGGDWPHAIVDETMHARYGDGSSLYHPAAAFDVFDLDQQKISTMRSAVTAFNDSVIGLRKGRNGADLLRDVRADIRSVPGMARFDHTADMIYHADRPVEAVYDKIASDSRLPDRVRSAATAAKDAVGALVLAHGEYSWFAPLNARYDDAAGPTAHLPLMPDQYDPWVRGGVTETHNEFFDAVHGRQLAQALGAYDASANRAVMVA